MVKTKLDEILDRLRITQQELEAEIERLLKDRRELFHYSLRRGKVVLSAIFVACNGSNERAYGTIYARHLSPIFCPHLLSIV